ncbi:hypothetical protein [Ancylomarina sp.]|uniref:hypothetical protein n=1 Tax=Ancylomarina sp. TaxID=1970196 RepID=UPI0035699500
MTTEEINNLKHTHGMGLEGLLHVYELKKFLKSLIIPSVITCVTYAGIILSGTNILSAVNAITQTVLSITPSLLGFLLGGYAIIIGFGDEKFLKSAAKISKEKPISTYQKFSGVFAISILSLGAALIVAFVFSLIEQIDASILMSTIIIEYTNKIALFLIIAISSYAVVQIQTMIVNIFNLSQMHHLTLIKQNMLDEMQKEQNKKASQ